MGVTGTAEAVNASASSVELGRSRQACLDFPATEAEIQERITQRSG
jgi:hypothetical protein